MFGCFTWRRIDTSFSIRCSCHARGERAASDASEASAWPCVQQNDTVHRPDAQGSTALGTETDQTLASLVSAGTGQVCVPSHCCSQRDTGILQNTPPKGSVVLPWHLKQAAFWPLHYFPHLKRSEPRELWHGTLRCAMWLEPRFDFGVVQNKDQAHKETWPALGIGRGQ